MACPLPPGTCAPIPARPAGCASRARRPAPFVRTTTLPPARPRSAASSLAPRHPASRAACRRSRAARRAVHEVVARALPLALAIAPLALGACGGGDDDDAGASRGQRGARRGAPSVVETPKEPYREVAIASPGTVVGTVDIAGDPPADTVVRPARDQQVCGAEVLDETIARNGRHLADVVVWLADVRSGRALPVERRYELTNERCRLVPRVQAAVAGGTLNVRSADAVVHRTQFVRLGTGDRLGSIETADAGAVVPDEDLLAKPGQVEATCAEHPWSRAWLLVFDHPYATVTGRDGKFRLDGVPPGRWKLVAWHERFGTRESTVEVLANGETATTITMQAR